MFLVLQHYFLCFKKEVSPALLRRFSEPYQIMLFVTHIWNQSGLCESLFCAVDTKAGLLFPTFCLIRDFSLYCFAPIHRNHLFPRKIQYFLVPPAVREPTVFWALSLQRSIKFWAENSLSHLRLFFQPERLSGICFRLLCNTCCWWQCRSFSTSREERWLNRKANFIKEIWIT